MAQNIIKHFPVMCSNVIAKIQNMQYARPFTVIDCNFGFGGHSRKILQMFPNALVQAYDLDSRVIDYYRRHYEPLLTEGEKKRLHIINANFSSLTNSKMFERCDVILADFGFCSFHLQTQCGFSWLKDEELDMRYSPQCRLCSEVINNSSTLELMSILQRFGQLRGAKAIAESIIQNRPIRTTKQLKEAILKCFQEDKTRKIAQVFQAFRIATNNQLKSIEQLCLSLQHCLQKNGLFLGITFHSLERDVIHRFWQQKTKMFSKIEAESPTSEEVVQNSKSKSAKMLSFRRKN